MLFRLKIFVKLEIIKTSVRRSSLSLCYGSCEMYWFDRFERVYGLADKARTTLKGEIWRSFFVGSTTLTESRHLLTDTTTNSSTAQERRGDKAYYWCTIKWSARSEIFQRRGLKSPYPSHLSKNPMKGNALITLRSTDRRWSVGPEVNDFHDTHVHRI